MVIAWVVLGVGLLLFEMHHMAFYAVFGAVGALAAAVVAAFLARCDPPPGARRGRPHGSSAWSSCGRT